MPAPPLITTSRLMLRLAETGDISALLRFYRENADHLAPTSPLLPPDFLTESFWIRQLARNNDEFAQRRAVKLFLFDKSEPATVVGQISLNTIVYGAAFYCDLGYSLGEDRQ